MIEILTHIQQGLTIASRSFLMIWEHRKLLLYLLIPVLLNFMLPIYSTYDFVYTLISRGAPDDAILVLKAMSKAIFADLGIACISIHSFMLLEHEVSSVKSTILTLIKRIPILMSWSIISGAIIYITLSIAHMISNYFNEMRIIMWGINGIQVMLGIGWMLTMFFMIQIIALEKYSIIESLQRSIALSRAVILEIIGGEFWIGLIWLLSIIPFAILFGRPMAYQLFDTGMIQEWSWVTIYALIIIGWVCATAQAVFRTQLYYYYYIQPREEEIEVLFYPRF